MSMRRVCMATLAAAAILQAAMPSQAADLGGGSRAYAEAPLFDRTPWTGAYVGASIGRNWGSTRIEDATGNGTIDTSGGLVGLTAGYSWQSGRFVMGGELEGNFGWLQESSGSSAAADLNWLVAARMRAGLLLTPALYVYGMAGIAAADLELQALTISRTELFTGYQLGVGAEYRFDSRWGLRLDYLYTDLGSKESDFPGFRQSFDPDFHTVRAGITMRF